MWPDSVPKIFFQNSTRKNKKKAPQKITEKTGVQKTIQKPGCKKAPPKNNPQKGIPKNNSKKGVQKTPAKKQSYEYKENNKKKFWNSQMDYQKRTIW